MQKVTFECKECEATGFIKLPDECDDYEVSWCPACGAPLDTDFGDDGD